MLEFSEADRNYDVLIKANFAGLLTHVMWTGLFIWLNVPILIIANVISFFIYLLCFLLVRREAHYTHYFLVSS